MSTPMTQEDKIKRGAPDSGQYFRQMMDFVGFTRQDAAAIRESSLVIEKHIPNIVADFYTHLLRYPPTRKHFLRKDGTVDHEYLQKRMHHLGNFWRRTASGEYDDEYARYVDYVGRAHTRHGADPNIYIAERYVIGQVGFMQRAINEALATELHEDDPDLERRATRAWNMIMMVILEMLARVYEETTEPDAQGKLLAVNFETVRELAIDTYEKGLGLGRPRKQQEVRAASVSEITDGERKIVEANGLSIGVFHHRGHWYALRNQCLHAGGPVCTGVLNGDTLTCPWHGYQYNVTTGELLVDPSVHLEGYPIRIEGDDLFLTVPEPDQAFTGDLFLHSRDEEAGAAAEPVSPAPAPVSVPALKKNEFLAASVPPGQAGLVQVDGADVAIYNVGGTYYATQSACTHAGGPLNEGDLNGSEITCPWHGSCFDVTSGEVRRGPAKEPLRTYRVTMEGGIGRVESMH